MPPRKKFRGQRRYFRNLQRAAARFRIDLRQGRTYDLWHHHFDWAGHGRRSARHRRAHLAALFVAFDRALGQYAESGRDVQAFLSIAPPQSAEQDAIFIHTPTSRGREFPYPFDGVRWGIRPPELLAPFVRAAWEVGEVLQREGWLVVRPRSSELREPRIAFDSNAVNYFLRANAGREFPPRDRELSDVDRQHVATIRLTFAYRVVAVPAVQKECLAIRDEISADERARFFCSFFHDATSLDGTDPGTRARHFLRFHDGETDCRIVAEAICEGCDVLVTNDRKLARRLRKAASPLLLLTPTEAWERFQRKPFRRPAPGHPLDNEDWWRW